MACSCTGLDLFVTGVPNCIPLVGVIKRIILVPLTDASGVRNGVTLSSIPTNVQILALINQEDPTKRFSPVAKSMENVTNERGDNRTEEFPSGTTINLGQGVKTFHGEFIKQGATLAGELNKVQCISIGAYLVDSTGALVGDKSVDGFLYPMPIKDGTWSAKAIDTTDSTSAKVNLDFQWADSITDGDVGYLGDSDFDADVNWLTYIGLIAIFGAAATGVTTTEFAMFIFNNFGAVTGQPVTNLDKGDFDLNELSPTPAVITIDGAVESTSTPGQYLVTWTTPQDPNDIIELSIKSTTLGFEDTGLKLQTVEI